jgi:hypothetical protein
MIPIIAESDGLRTILKMYMARFSAIKQQNEFYNSLCGTKNIFF